jgi:hypothetical protein
LADPSGTQRRLRESTLRPALLESVDENFVGRTAKFLDELIWMARVLRYGREKVAPT